MPVQRAVLDTNVVVSGLLWLGPPRQVLDSARAGKTELFTSPGLLAELLEVLRRPKFAGRLSDAGVSATKLVSDYAALAVLVQPAAISPVISLDPDDDAVLACAAAAQADLIVSGDVHLLQLGAFRGIPVFTASQLLASIAPKEG